MHKIVFTNGTLPRRVVFWGIFFQFLHIVSLPILSSCYVFLCFSISWKPFNYFTSVCFTDVLGITLRIILGVWYSVLESCSTLSYEFLYICYLYYYGAYFRYSPQCLEKLERFFWYFAQMSWYYCVGHYIKEFVGFTSTLDICGFFSFVL